MKDTERAVHVQRTLISTAIQNIDSFNTTSKSSIVEQASVPDIELINIISGKGSANILYLIKILDALGLHISYLGENRRVIVSDIAQEVRNKAQSDDYYTDLGIGLGDHLRLIHTKTGNHAGDLDTILTAFYLSGIYISIHK